MSASEGGGGSGISPLGLFSYSSGRDPISIIVQGFAAWFMSIFLGVISGTQAIVDLLVFPIQALADAGVAAVENLIIRPLGLTEPAFGITSQALQTLSQEFTFFGLISLPVSVVLIGVTITIVLFIGSWSVTGFIPGFVVDNRLLGFFFTTPEEEAEGEE